MSTFEEKVKSNVWHDYKELPEVGKIIKECLQDENWCWVYNSQCKYLSIRIDMRDGGFIVVNRDGKRIDPESIKYQRNAR